MHPQRYSYSTLRHATSSFSPSNRLGQGGFGPVYQGTLSSGKQIAVKLMDKGSLQGEHEFNNELSLAGGIDSDHVVSLIGFSSDKKKRGGRRMVLVYELMVNGSLQDALLNRMCPELMDWKKRVLIAVDIAKGLEFLHRVCDPPVIHGDVKPGNVLLDSNFNAKIADFGLSRLKNDREEVLNGIEVVELDDTYVRSRRYCGDDASTTDVSVGDSASVTTSVGDDEKTPERFLRVVDAETSPEADNNKISGHDKGKNYVMEWIESSNAIIDETSPSEKLEKKQQRRLKGERRPAKKWWSEEFCEELSTKEEKKKKKKRAMVQLSSRSIREQFTLANDSKMKSRRRSSWGSIDFWLDGLNGLSGEIRKKSSDWASGEIPKSGTLTNTNASMRGTICYVAPENGNGGVISEKCDVYSYGVLLLVLIAGRRPLQIGVSPVSEFERANLVLWARHLARRGKLLDLVDPGIQCLDEGQALVCIRVALQCLQHLPSKRLTIDEVVRKLSDVSQPHLPAL
ncbi:hypothetical protein GIB67_040688 [Kingdonia uniflora]|uniref:Protein kinase domain-containing protein n=1 Tax=Kingdonia uniflora TaxID=39325 RepID=A0A7J7KUC7_9MAGN|nr:hypothetical protein GIB67_040688 [Kingdonia uniflora]